VTLQLPASLKADCSACVGLCCVIPPFDALQGFGFDKPAETPCRHLCTDHRCGIHDQLIDRGFEGCVAFDCHGAGQRLTALAVERFGSADWRARPEVARWLFAAYSRFREAQRWLAMLELAAGLPGRAGAAEMAESLDREADRWAEADAQQWADWQARVQAALQPTSTQDPR
jgi:hypothetical protein